MSGYVGGRLDALIMRVCDVMLSFPSILIALLFAGVGHALFPNANDLLAFGVSSSPSPCPAGCSTRAPCAARRWSSGNKEYVQAARVIGVAPLRIMLRHVLPNVMGRCWSVDDPGGGRDPGRGDAIVPRRRRIADLALSGTFINEGNKQLFSGAWWLVIFPGATLVLIALSINLFGDWLRDALNPRLR